MKVYERNDKLFTYPDEMERILTYLNERGKNNVKASSIENLYYNFSDERYCATWMCVDESLLAEFEEWLIHVDI